MFAKHWQPGTVKTRLATSIGNEAAAVHWLRTPETVNRPEVSERVAVIPRPRDRPRPNLAVIDRLNSGVSRVAISRERKLGTTLIMVSADANAVP